MKFEIEVSVLLKILWNLMQAGQQSNARLGLACANLRQRQRERERKKLNKKRGRKWKRSISKD
jgi:hypothetical protein